MTYPVSGVRIGNEPSADAPRRRRPIYVGAEVYRKFAYHSLHPLAVRRVEIVEDLCRALGWLDDGFVVSKVASREELLRFHDSDYVEALSRADLDGHTPATWRERYGIGTMENPVFPGVFERASTSVGGSILAARLAAEGRIVFHPAGGTHHGLRARANGFCYFNDPVFAGLELLGRGFSRVAFVDLDAHHGDGLEEAFASDQRVVTISIHEAGRWPHGGALGDRREGRAFNLPVPPGFNDSEFGWLIDNVVAKLLERFAPQAIVVICGADALKGDPLSRMALSNVALWEAFDRIGAFAPAVVALGGGGYNPWTLARCWSGLWGRIAGHRIPERLPREARLLLASLTCDLVDDDDRDPLWLDTLADAPNRGSIRGEIYAIGEATLKA
jgi:acetoin utilization protein AcuC